MVSKIDSAFTEKFISSHLKKHFKIIECGESLIKNVNKAARINIKQLQQQYLKKCAFI